MNIEQQERDFLKRSSWIWIGIFYGSVILSLALALRAVESGGEAVRVILLSMGVTAAVSVAIGLVIRDGERARRRAWPQALLLLSSFYLWWQLVTILPTFYLLLFGLYGQIYLLVRIHVALGLAAVLTGFVTYAQFGADGAIWSSSALLYFLAFTIFGGLFGVWVNGIIQQSGERKVMIQQLRQAQAQLARAERREGMLAERQRLAREIHDTLAQGFTSIVMHLEAAEQALPPGAETSQRHLSLARTTARESLQEARRVVRDLRPEVLEQDSLPRALERTVERWSGESGIGGSVVVTGDILPLHPEAEVTLLRVVQEALSNVRKHAEASEATVTLSYMNDVVMLDVQDDGVGMERANGARELSGGFGLRGMRERIGHLSGSMLIETAPGEGTTLVVEIPVTGRSAPTREENP